MRYINEVLKKNLWMTFAYILLGVFHAFLVNYKADYFQKIIDGLSDGTLVMTGIVIYGTILLTDYVAEYVDEYPAKSWNMVFIWILNCWLSKKLVRLIIRSMSNLERGNLFRRLKMVQKRDGTSFSIFGWCCSGNCCQP